MNHSTIMKAAAIVSALFGVALLLAPNALLEMYKGQQLNSPGIYNSMLAGAYLLAIAVMNWNASKEPSIAGARHVILGTFAGMILGLAVTVIRQLTDASLPASGWLNVVIFAVFSGLFGYLQFTQVPAAARAASAA